MDGSWTPPGASAAPVAHGSGRRADVGGGAGIACRPEAGYLARHGEHGQRQERADRRAAARAQIRQYPDPVLRRSRGPSSTSTTTSRRWRNAWSASCTTRSGAGLAAPQIGLLRRLFVFQADVDSEPRALVNPEIVERSEETAIEGEGCLSLYTLIDEDLTVPVERAVRITVRARDLDGGEVEFEAEGHEARIIQHEVDHLEGKLIVDTDRAADADARRDAMRVLRH